MPNASLEVHSLPLLACWPDLGTGKSRHLVLSRRCALSDGKLPVGHPCFLHLGAVASRWSHGMSMLCRLPSWLLTGYGCLWLLHGSTQSAAARQTQES